MTMEDAREIMKKLREIEELFKKCEETNDADIFIDITDYSIDCVLSLPVRNFEDALQEQLDYFEKEIHEGNY